jgi:hypothetical protein
MTKKQIIYGILSIVTIGVLATAGAFALRHLNKSNENTTIREDTPAPNQKVSITDEEAKSLLLEAGKARTAGNYDAARSSYQKAQEHYKETGNTTKAAELDATISLIETEKKNSEAIVKPKLAGEE